MEHLEVPGGDPVAGGGVAVVEMDLQARIAPVLQAGMAPLVMDRDHGIQGEAHIAVARGEQRDRMAAGHEAVREGPGVGFEAAREGRGDRVAQMGEERDPHAVTGAGSPARASMARMTEAAFVYGWWLCWPVSARSAASGRRRMRIGRSGVSSIRPITLKA